MYVVTSANGRTGSVAAQTLLDRGAAVRVVVRDAGTKEDWERKGAEVAVADLTDLGAMTAALADAHGAYIVSPQQYGRDDLFEHAAHVVDVVAEAAVTASVRRLVALSSVGADRESSIGWIGMNRTMEQRLRQTGIPTVFIRAAYFIENWTPAISHAVGTGTLRSFLSPLDRALPMIATADIGQLAADLLMEGWTDTRAIDFAGPDCSPSDVAKAIGRAIGRNVRAETIGEADWPAALATSGFSANALAGFCEMTRGLNNGHISFEDQGSTERRVGQVSIETAIAGIVSHTGVAA